jgi:hypothetical protein
LNFSMPEQNGAMAGHFGPGMKPMKRHIWTILMSVLLAGCDQISERAGFPDPAKVEADGKAIGGACRHAGRGLEDCYRLNKGASKSAVFAGWKEMNEYMLKNDMQAVEPSIGPVGLDHGKKGKTEEAASGARARRTRSPPSTRMRKRTRAKRRRQKGRKQGRRQSRSHGRTQSRAKAKAH